MLQLGLRLAVGFPIARFHSRVRVIHRLACALQSRLELLLGRQTRCGRILAIALGPSSRHFIFGSLHPGVAAKELIEGSLQSRGESNLVTERRQHKAQQRIRGTGLGLDIDRLDIQQTPAHRQGQQITANDLGGLLRQQVQGLRNRVGGLELVGHLARTGNRQVRRQGQQTQLAVPVTHLAGL